MHRVTDGEGAPFSKKLSEYAKALLHCDVASDHKRAHYHKAGRLLEEARAEIVRANGGDWSVRPGQWFEVPQKRTMEESISRAWQRIKNDPVVARLYCRQSDIRKSHKRLRIAVWSLFVVAAVSFVESIAALIAAAS